MTNAALKKSAQRSTTRRVRRGGSLAEGIINMTANAQRILDIIADLEEFRANMLLGGMAQVAAELNKIIADLMWLHKSVTFYDAE